jgi:hypothetical protein
MKITLNKQTPLNLNKYQKFFFGAIKYIQKTKQSKHNILKQIKLSYKTNKFQQLRDNSQDFD